MSDRWLRKARLIFGSALLLVCGWGRDGAWAQVGWNRLDAAGPPSARTGHAIVCDTSREVYVLYGGTWNEYRLGDTWELSGTTWRRIALGEADSPPPLTAHAMVYDVSRDRTVLFGGQEGISDASGELQTVFNGEVYEFNGARWERVAVPEPRPAARAAQAMAYDSKRGYIWLFGGRKKIDTELMELLGDVWYYDGSIPAWQEVGSASGPSPRESSSLVYDASNDRLLLFGGGFFGSWRTGETWELNPASGTWRIIDSTAAPSSRQNAAMAYLGNGRSALFGGSRSTSQVNGETWTLDGSQWTRVWTSPSPGARAAAALAFDLDRREGILFGGYAFENLNDTWRLAVVSPTATPTVVATPTATLEPSLPFDLTGDGRLDARDLFILSQQWAASAPAKQQSAGLTGDFTGDDQVDAGDLLFLIMAWAERDPQP